MMVTACESGLILKVLCVKNVFFLCFKVKKKNFKSASFFFW